MSNKPSWKWIDDFFVGVVRIDIHKLFAVNAATICMTLADCMQYIKHKWERVLTVISMHFRDKVSNCQLLTLKFMRAYQNAELANANAISDWFVCESGCEAQFKKRNQQKTTTNGACIVFELSKRNWCSEFWFSQKRISNRLAAMHEWLAASVTGLCNS